MASISRGAIPGGSYKEGPHHIADNFHRGRQPPRDWQTDEHRPKIKAMMQGYVERTHGQIHLAGILKAAGKTQKDLPTFPKYMYIPLDAPSCAGQAFLENAAIGTAGSTRKAATPSRGTSRRSSLTKSLTSLAKG